VPPVESANGCSQAAQLSFLCLKTTLVFPPPGFFPVDS
jgi:hypothetical protein